MKKLCPLLIALLLGASLLSACSGAAATPSATEAATNTPISIPAATEAAPTETLSNTSQYEPVDASVCQTLQQLTADALKVDVSMTSSAPFSDPLAGESGQGCQLKASGTGMQFSSVADVMTLLKNSTANGWYERASYQADGPMGSADGYYRDMALMILSVNWEPASGANCPADQPIASCDLKPEQKLYTVEVDVAQYKADFSMDGKWVDSADNFTLNLYQEWKHIYGSHEVVAENGNKIDSLDVSIDGWLDGKTVKVTFQSSFASDPGSAQITYVDVNTIQWKIITPPNGEYYLPQEATLTRQ